MLSLVTTVELLTRLLLVSALGSAGLATLLLLLLESTARSAGLATLLLALVSRSAGLATLLLLLLESTARSAGLATLLLTLVSRSAGLLLVVDNFTLGVILLKFGRRSLLFFAFIVIFIIVLFLWKEQP